MNGEDRHAEGNAVCLLRAALGPEARPDPGLRQEALERLLRHVRRRQAAVPFPDAVVVLLGGLLAAGAGLLLALMLDGAVSPSQDLPLGLGAAALMLNLALVPVAGIVVLLRRRNEC